VAIHLRGGNTGEPDAGWTAWTAAEGDPLSPDGALAELPATRFVQWRLTLSGSGRDEPSVRSVLLRYLPANRAPRIESLQLEPPGLAFRALPPARVASGERPVLAELIPSEVEAKLGANKAKERSKKAFEPGVRTAIWKASDPDGDHLVYDVDVARMASDRWLAVARELDRSFHSFDTRTLPDGRYRLRLVARDDTDNGETRARRSELVSAPFLVDNRPPEIVDARARWEEASLLLTLSGRDATGPVRRAEVAFDGGSWRSYLPDDGVGDSRRERFRIRLSPPDRPGPLLVRVFDEAGNVATAEVAVPAREP
jgi:hypothetical protein